MVNTDEVQVVDALPEVAQELWDRVFHLSNTILQQQKMHAFDEIRANAPHPNVETILLICKYFDIAFDAVQKRNEIEEIGYDAMRQILNAKKQIATMEQLALAIREGKDEDYELAAQALRAQAAF